MGQYLLQTENGTTPPKFIHHDIDLAVTEAKRLCELHNTSVRILEIVGEVKEVDVPVTRKETKVILAKRLIEEPDLPF